MIRMISQSVTPLGLGTEEVVIHSNRSEKLDTRCRGAQSETLAFDLLSVLLILLFVEDWRSCRCVQDRH